jgi:flagellar biosynthesis/type III secretory pathway protein FliH
MNMKSSPNLRPSENKPQIWTPVDFQQNNLGSNPDATIESNGKKPVALFAKLVHINGKSDSVTRVIKEAQNIVTSNWLPGNITSTIPAVSEIKPDWQPSLKFATTTAPHDISREIINDARREAEEIILTAQKTAKGIQEQAYQDGWNSAIGEIKSHMDTASTLVQQISDWRDNLMSQSEQMILNLVCHIAQKMFGEGYILDSETLQATFNKVLENARSLGNLRIYVHPEDASNLGPYWRELQESITTHTIEIVPSGSIARGGCYVNGQWGSADGRIETQLKVILDTIDSEASVVES